MHSASSFLDENRMMIQYLVLSNDIEIFLDGRKIDGLISDLQKLYRISSLFSFCGIGFQCQHTVDVSSLIKYVRFSLKVVFTKCCMIFVIDYVC